jgi:hypothetical protein
MIRRWRRRAPSPNSLTAVIGRAHSQEKVRGLIALVLVGILLALTFHKPSGAGDLVASSKTLAIAVLGFYFGLHKGTGDTAAGRTLGPSGPGGPGPESPAPEEHEANAG